MCLRFLFSILAFHIASAMAQAEQSSDVSPAAAYEATVWANGPVDSNPFYNAPTDSSKAPPGTLLKVEANTNASHYSLAPGIAISRIMYQTERFAGGSSLAGESVPASAYILWPYRARKLPDGSRPGVVWAHGTHGLFGNCAPSNVKTLWEHFAAPYPLALQGYVAVAPDYAGHGVTKTSDGKPIVNQYIANPAAANDIFYAFQAARSAFKELSAQFVVMGHSQGGGAAWSAEQRQALKPVDGYLGAVALSPVTNVLDLPDTGNPLIPILAAFMTPVIKDLYPEFDPTSVFTDEGWEHWQQYEQSQGCNPVAVELLTGFQLVKHDWMSNKFVQEYVAQTANGGPAIGGPLLVIQGEADPNLNVTTTGKAVDRLVKNFPQAAVQYLTLPGVTHTPSLYTLQQV